MSYSARDFQPDTISFNVPEPTRKPPVTRKRRRQEHQPMFEPVQRQQRVVISSQLNPGIAAVLSFFFPGLGHLYSGCLLTGFTFMALQLFCFVIAVLSLGLLSPLAIAIWFFGILSAYADANRMNRKRRFFN